MKQRGTNIKSVHKNEPKFQNFSQKSIIFFFKIFTALLPSSLIFDFNPHFFLIKKYIECYGNLLTPIWVFNTQLPILLPTVQSERGPQGTIPSSVSHLYNLTVSAILQVFISLKFSSIALPKQVQTGSCTAPPIPCRTSSSGSAQMFQIFVFIICFYLTLCPIYSSKFWISYYCFLKGNLKFWG
jgi:hypothetical protein